LEFEFEEKLIHLGDHLNIAISAKELNKVYTNISMTNCKQQYPLFPRLNYSGMDIFEEE
jgi:hypothetical protein